MISFFKKKTHLYSGYRPKVHTGHTTELGKKLTGKVDDLMQPMPFEMAATVLFHPSCNNGICPNLEAGNNVNWMLEPKMNYDLLLTGG